MENKEMHLALHNCGYRFLSKKTRYKYIYGKPIGYGILRADISYNKIEILLIVKGNPEGNKQPNLVWNSHSYNISSLNNNTYLDYVQFIKDCEAYIFSKSPIAFEMNRFIRYDFKENHTIDDGNIYM